MKGMRKSLTVIGAVAAVALPVTTASAASATESVYTHTEMYRCLETGAATDACVDIFTNATYSGTQIWVNGNVQCEASSVDGEAYVTWCGVGGGNGTATLDVGANWTDPGPGDFYQRINIPADGNTGIDGNWPATNNGEGCSSNGTNSPGIWETAYFVCNNLGGGSPQY